MIIREAQDHDIPAIVELLKLSLGESLMPKSESFWRWKHVDNPFGKSPVLLAEEDGQLIGVRAFMRWEWSYQNKIYKAVRAVDTATHPQHQGKGIFKRLTLQLVDQCKAEGIDFIFNTPNTSSKPGYLKMGWMSNGKMKLHIRPVLAFKKKSKDFDTQYNINPSTLSLPTNYHNEPTCMQTAVSESFLTWRYASNPNIHYYTFADNKSNPSYRTIFRLKPHRFGGEFRVCGTCHSHLINKKDYSRHLMEVVRASGANLVTSAMPIQDLASISLAAGPEITTHPLSFDHNFLSFSLWKPSLGDMEVF